MPICHDKIDPLGFALEAYDDKGGWFGCAQFDYGNAKACEESRRRNFEGPIDTSGRAVAGWRTSLRTLNELKQILMTTTQREPIVRNIVKQMLAYALVSETWRCYDQPTVETIVGELLTTNDGTWRDLVHAIANSLPFQRVLMNTAWLMLMKVIPLPSLSEP